MTPLQMANAECPNLNNGACDGMRFDDKLKPLPGKALDRCWLAADKRCDYFEECVMPMAAIVSAPVKSKSYINAADSYRILHRLSGVTRQCPECGRPLPARHRLCADCVAKHRRQTTRTAMRRIRGVAVSS